MIPRVFVSSTYYDLKYVRERLETFIETYGFEAILFESDKVTYQHEKSLDQSAYYEVELCHIMVLIIGGRYGAPSTSINIDEERKKYDDFFVSVTRTEFETALKKNIPVLIFVDKNVYSEYQTYKENQDFFDQQSIPGPDAKKIKNFRFAHVDHVNVFKFIDLVKTKPIKTFDKIEEIEVYIKYQLAGMFYLYLELLKRKSDDNKILDTISELNNVTLRMNEMITSVGKEILGKDKKEYERVIDAQLSIMLDFFVEQFSQNIDFDNELPEDVIENEKARITEIIYNTAINIELPLTPKAISVSEKLKQDRLIIQKILFSVNGELAQIDEKISIKTFNIRKINRVFIEKVKPFIKNSADEKYLKNLLEKEIAFKLSELPF